MEAVLNFKFVNHKAHQKDEVRKRYETNDARNDGAVQQESNDQGEVVQWEGRRFLKW